MPTFEERFNKLNEGQRKAVQAIEGPVLVIAGPGSGKTEILGLRVANILKKTDTHPGSILCLTFTDSAAANMRERLSGLIGSDAYRVVIATFHSFSTDIINRFPEYFYNGAAFSPADELTQMEILEGIFKELPYDNPLRTQHPVQGFTYLGSARKSISQLKKAGIGLDAFARVLKSNAHAIGGINKKMEIFDARMSMKQIAAIRECAAQLDVSAQESALKEYAPLAHAVARSLEEAVSLAGEQDTIAPLSRWKSDWVKKNDDMRVFKDTMYMEKLSALADVYNTYLTRMHERGYYDFDDMLLNVLEALERNSALRYELQERYQYILVDEFQDTNDAQMKLISFLTDARVHEGRPNIMVVGDDDQAVYKFQGAEISNILEFQRRYRDPEIITLTHNYRSRQDILDLARHIILKGTERLERRIAGLRKDLVAAGNNIKEGAIASRVFPSSAHERHFIGKEIKKLIEGGAKPDHIVVIARHHRDLEALLPYFAASGIPVAYERQRNVLHEPHVYQIIQIARFISSLARKNRAEADEYLPEILSFPFWGLERNTIWELSASAGARGALWLETMMHHTDARLRSIADLFLNLALRAQHEPAEYVLDAIIGSPSYDDRSALWVRGSHENAMEGGAVSPFREYYFGKEKFARDKATYLSFLSGLHAFVRALREYKQGRFLKIDDLVAFVDMHEKNNMPITDQSPFVAADKAVHLLSAHKAKGLEFETVFVLSCQDNIWAGSPRGSMLPFPMNLPIAPAGDTMDDQLRLFYVALTRAKHNLYLTSFEKMENGKSSARLRFLIEEEGGHMKTNVKAALAPAPEEKEDTPEPTDIFSAGWEQYNRGPRIADEEALLRALVKDYQMSVTHLNNFLNVKKGGPQAFLEQNLLRFPQAKTPSLSYGSAMHKAIELLYLRFKKEGVLPPPEHLTQAFERALEMQRLAKDDFMKYLAQGKNALTKFYEMKKERFSQSDLVEVNFKNQGVLVGEAHLTGKLDKMVFKSANEIVVHDFKTGNPADEWEGEGVYEKIKLHNYKRQLVFYKLLVEYSRDFSERYAVHRGVLEFLEPYHGKIIDLPLEISGEDVKRTTALIGVVYKKILSLDFPDISKYSKDLAGTLEFEEDLLK